MRKCLYTVIIALLFMACRSKEAPLDVNQMKAIVWDLMKADEWFTTQTIKDSTVRIKKENIRLYEQVFLIHSVTKDRFYKSYAYYEAHPGQMKVLIDSIELYSAREREKLSNQNHGQKKK